VVLVVVIWCDCGSLYQIDVVTRESCAKDSVESNHCCNLCADDFCCVCVMCEAVV
jgi:hypothetical protein